MPVSPRRARAAATLACSVLLLAPAAGRAAELSAPALDDGYIDAADPGRAFGDAKQLLVSRSPLRTAYLRFRVDGASRAAHRMVLRLHALGGAGDAVLVVRRLGARDWRERTLTARAAPRVGRVAGSRGSFGRRWISVKLGAPAPVGGVYGLALTVVGDDLHGPGSARPTRSSAARAWWGRTLIAPFPGRPDAHRGGCVDRRRHATAPGHWRPHTATGSFGVTRSCRYA